jgi:polysaccharide pyruvyl transferase WcaK-like protein
MKEFKNILLRGSWQTRNIGDIAHTPGFLALARQVMPDKKIWLWPCELDRGVREMLLSNFPSLTIVEKEDELERAFEICDLLINGSGPGVDLNGMELWYSRTGKPYGFFGVSADGFWSEKKREIFSNASFIFCRDSLSVHFLKAQRLACPVISFGPDASYYLDLARGESAADFLRENGLEKEKFICVIPRLRWTPVSFDDENFYYKEPFKEQATREHLEEDMEKMRAIICHIVRNTPFKVLICPEMTYQVPLGRRYLYERLPADVQARCVLKKEYWITDEALGVYAACHTLVSMEMHSPIMFTALGKPALLLRQAEDTWKGQMWRDTGLQKWIFELNDTDAEEITESIDTVIRDYPRACAAARRAREKACDAGRKALETIVQHINR